MNEFANRLIMKDEPYENGFFAKVPKLEKRAAALILTGGVKDDIVVKENTTTKEIRQGKYTRLVEISTSPYMKEIRFRSPSKESAFSFDVYVKAVIQIEDPILFFQSKNIDVDAYFDNLFSLDVRKITRKYSILNYEGMDEELTRTLSAVETVDEATGFTYRISVVATEPGERAEEFVEKQSRQRLEAGLKKDARNLGYDYSHDYREAVMAEVAEGKISETEAIKRIDEYYSMKFNEKMKNIEGLRESGFITNKDAMKMVQGTLEENGRSLQIEKLEEKNKVKKTDFDSFYTEEEI